MCQKLVSFRQFITTAAADHDVKNYHIVNMDELPLTFDIVITRTVNKKGSKSVTIQTMGHEKASFTVVLGCCASGDKSPPSDHFQDKYCHRKKNVCRRHRVQQRKRMDGSRTDAEMEYQVLPSL